MTKPPLIVHVIHRLGVGGLENGVVNLVNHMPAARYRHAIVCLTDYSDFRERIRRDEVDVFAIHRKPGKDPAAGWRLWKLLRSLRPAILHSRNLSGMNALLPGALAGVRCRIHGEHGWYDEDPDGSNLKYRILRRLHRPLVRHYVALSSDLERYLQQKIGVSNDRITRIYNGVDTKRFYPSETDRSVLAEAFPVADNSPTVVGSVGRFEKIKDPMNLASAFVDLLQTSPELRQSVRLMMVGDGPERKRVQAFLDDAGVAENCWLPGARKDVATLLGCIDVFVLPSRGEGISNTILEAMASGLPVVATRVGGNGELVADGETGSLVPHSDPHALASAIGTYVRSSDLCKSHGSAGRGRALEAFSLDTMVENYLELYDGALARHGE